MKLYTFVISLLLLPALVAASCVDFPRALKQGDTGADVYAMQRILNSDNATLIAKSGPGSRGQENEIFGESVTVALRAFQALYATSTSGTKLASTGVVDVPTRIKLSRLSCEIDVAPPVATSTRIGSGLCAAISLAPPPKVKVVLEQPLVIKVRRGAAISLYGSGFAENNIVDFGNTSTCGITSSDGGKRIDITVPTNAPLGEVYVRVTDKFGVSNLIKLFILEEGSSSTTVGCVDITRTLQLGSKGDDVRSLQEFLNNDERTRAAVSGPESSGNETTKFSLLTKTAVKLFQKLYATELLKPAKLTQPTGVIGVLARKKIRELTDCPTLVASKDVPTLTSISPKEAHVGDQVVLSGSYFTDKNYVMLGSASLDPVGSSNGSTAVVSLSSRLKLGLQKMAIRNAGGVSNALPFTLLAGIGGKAPKISSLYPSHAKAGATIEINGSGFTPKTNTISSIDKSVVVSGLASTNNGGALSFKIPAKTPSGSLVIRVVNENGESNTRAIIVDKEIPPPVIDSIYPEKAKQGAVIAIEGHYFTEPNTVYMDKVPLADVQSSGGSTEIRFTIPALATLGIHTVSVSTEKGESNSKTFEVTDKNADVPFIDSITPDSTENGVEVKVSGRNFTGTNFVVLGDTLVSTAIADTDGTTATFTLYSVAPGDYQLKIRNLAGESNAVALKVFVSEKPTITSVVPSSVAAGEDVTVNGLRVKGGVVLMDDKELVTRAGSNSSLVITVPSDTGQGTHTLQVKTIKGLSNTAEIQVGLANAPTIYYIAPSILPLSGGQITIFGSDFGLKVDVYIDKSPSPLVLSSQPASASGNVSLTVPDGLSEGIHDVWVKNQSGESNKVSLQITSSITNGCTDPACVASGGSSRPKINSLSDTSMTYEACFSGLTSKNVTIYGENFSTTTENTIKTGLLEGSVKKVSGDGRTLQFRIGSKAGFETAHCLPPKFLADPSKGFDIGISVENQFGGSNTVIFKIKPMIKLPF